MAALRRMRRGDGFTLVEIITATLLLGLATMAVIGVLVMGMNRAVSAQASASAWASGFAVLKDPKPLGAGATSDGILQPWVWSRVGSTWSASDGSADPAWQCTVWDIDSTSDILVPDMGAPLCNNPAVFPPSAPPLPGCARGWLNGYYVERREQSRAGDRIGVGVRMVEVRVDVYWASYGQTDGRPLASLVDRVVRSSGP